MAVRAGKKRGPGAAAAVVLAGMLCCWGGLAGVDRRIRGATIYPSPPLWECRSEGERLAVTVLGERWELELGPVRQAGEELWQLLQTPPAPVRVALAAAELVKGKIS